MNEILLLQYLDEFVEELKAQLIEDDKRWGETWRTRPKKGQEERIQARFNDYFDQFNNANIPVPWLKVVGNAYIAWVRENHGEALVYENVDDLLDDLI